MIKWKELGRCFSCSFSTWWSSNFFPIFVHLCRVGPYVEGKTWHLHPNNKSCCWQGICAQKHTHINTHSVSTLQVDPVLIFLSWHKPGTNLLLSSNCNWLKAAWRSFCISDVNHMDILHKTWSTCDLSWNSETRICQHCHGNKKILDNWQNFANYRCLAELALA